jgi:kanamycin kinase
VYYVEREGGCFLKIAEQGSLQREATITDYFHKRGLSAEVMYYGSGERDFLVTSRIFGEDCTHPEYLSDPKRLTDTIAYKLRELHELDFSDCPVQDRMSEHIALAERNFSRGNYSTEHFPDNFGYRSAEEAYTALQMGKNELKNEVLLHGDYCFPNVMLDEWRFSGFIDLGNGGVGDRHVDLFWGAWTLWFNLKTDRYRERFFDAYGKDLIDRDLLLVVAAAEIFG